ncbi:MAG: winged helix DNA-binding protein [Thalassobaculaceae bacterium]|nr:winged helix DNA-binding protein [Thalassobaculaceae bacterium]
MRDATVRSAEAAVPVGDDALQERTAADGRPDREPDDAAVRGLYSDLTGLLERLHRRHLDVVRLGLEGIGVTEINASQGLLLLTIGDGEIPVRDLIQRGYYQASSATYNIKKLVDYGYLEQIRSEHDRRAVRLRLGPSGRLVADRLRALDDRLARIAAEEEGLGVAMGDALRTLKKLDRVWADFLSFG